MAEAEHLDELMPLLLNAAEERANDLLLKVLDPLVQVPGHESCVYCTPFFRNYFVCLSFRCLRRKAALRDPEAHAAGTSGIFKRLKARSNDANRDLYTDLKMCASIFLLSGVKYRSLIVIIEPTKR